MMVAELRDLMVATYSDVSPISWVSNFWTLTGMVGGPCGPAAALLLLHDPSSSTDATAAARTMANSGAFEGHTCFRTL